MENHAALFTPVQLGPIELKHRVVMPALSRLRARTGRVACRAT